MWPRYKREGEDPEDICLMIRDCSYKLASRVLQVENQRLYTIVDRLNTRGSDRSSDTASQLSDLSTYAPREVTHLRSHAHQQHSMLAIT